MATEYVQTGTGLVNLVEPKIKNFESIECVRKALAAGELHNGEHWTTYCTFTVPTDDLAALVYEMHSYIPAGTNPDDNKLVNQAMVCGLDLDDLPNIKACNEAQEAAIEEVKQDITDIKTCNTNQQTAIEARVTCTDYSTYTAANDACMACRVQCCDFTNFQTANTTALNGKVACSDFNDNVTCVNNRLTAIENVSIPDLDICICCAEERLTCLEARADVLENITVDPTSGLVSTVSDLSADYHARCTNWDNLINCRVQCCDFNDFVTNIGSYISDRVTCTDYQTCCTAWDTAISNLSSCAGLNCTGTLVASDLDTINTCIACLKACPGLDCTGTVTGSRVSCSDFESCCSTWNTCISCLKSCSGLDCTGTLTSSDLDSYATKTCVKTIVNGIFSLSGNVLTITSV